MEKKLLTNPDTPPTREVLKSALGNTYSVFDELMVRTSFVENDLLTEWRYYKDGKSWLCKVCYRRKTMFWLSVWDGYFKTGFYFMPRHSEGVMELDIDEKVKHDFLNNKTIGQLIPLVINVERIDQIKDVLEIVRYKKSLK